MIGSRKLDHIDRVTVRAMNAAMFRRGPDGAGEFSTDQAIIAMRRLAIIDLTGGWQPLYNEDRSIALVANGEVYNYIELQNELAAKGHRFNTKSDCELPAHLYEEHGLDFVHHLRGMYAIAMWDSKKKRLILVRDRMGEKPLFIHERIDEHGEKQILFASEMKALLASGVVPMELDPPAIAEFYHYTWLHDPKTMVKGVRKLAPGTMMVIETDPWSVREIKYWDLKDSPPIDKDPAPTIRAVLEDVGEMIIRSEVPVGVALSGGIDSSTIACLAAKKYPGTMHAFSVGWVDKPGHDERTSARSLAKTLRMPMHEVEIHPEHMTSFFPQLPFLTDDPIADVTGYAYYVVNKLAREHGCVVLMMGQGGDELFWGYPWVRDCVDANIEAEKSGKRKGRNPLTDLLPTGRHRSQLVAWAFRLGGMIYGWRTPGGHKPLSLDELSFYETQDITMHAQWAMSRIFTPAAQQAMASYAFPSHFTIPKPRQSPEILLTDLICKGYLLGNGINQGDRLGMASSVELRLPLVDYKLAETVVGLRKARPGDHRLGTKAWLRMACQDLVPQEIFNRPKRGFNPPVTQWYESLRNAHGDQLTDGYLVSSGILDPRSVRSMATHQSRLSAWNELFFRSLVLEFWSRSMASVANQARSDRAANFQGRFDNPPPSPAQQAASGMARPGWLIASTASR